MIIGIDEVGRGCWAGPLVVAASRLDVNIDGLADSKDLSEKKRILLEKEIHEKAKGTAVAAISPAEIDQIGLTAAMERACQIVFSEISKEDEDIVIIDGNINYLPGHPGATAQIKADSTVPSVMAASIIAKQYRDKVMRLAAKEYPEFGWETNVGYGTKAHMLGLAEFGVTEHHRKSFKPIKKYVSEAGFYSRREGSQDA